MLIEIRTVKRFKDNSLGRTRFPSKQRALIEILEGQELKDFGIAFFHELLHVWTNVMKTSGAAIDMRKEHRFIYAMHKPLNKNVPLMGRK